MSFDVAAIRRQFPILSEIIDGRPVHYLDNGASAQSPTAVLDAVRATGWPAAADWYRFERSQQDMLALLWQETPQLFHDEFELSFGNCDPRGLKPERRLKPREPEIEAKLERLCPRLLAHYRARDAHSQV